MTLETEERRPEPDRVQSGSWEFEEARANLHLEPGAASHARAEALLEGEAGLSPYGEVRLTRAALMGELRGAIAREQIEQEIDAAAANIATRGIVAFDRDVCAARAVLAGLVGDEAARVEHLRAARKAAAALGAERWVARYDAQLESAGAS
jgi:hypothetical protein